MSAFCSLHPPVQFRLRFKIILSELHTLLEKHGQLSFQGSRERLFVRTELFPFSFENPTHSPNLTFFHLSTTVSRILKVVQYLAWISPCWNVSENERHRMGKHFLRALEKKVVKSTVGDFRRIQGGCEIVNICVEAAPSRQ